MILFCGKKYLQFKIEAMKMAKKMVDEYCLEIGVFFEQAFPPEMRNKGTLAPIQKGENTIMLRCK